MRPTNAPTDTGCAAESGQTRPPTRRATRARPATPAAVPTSPARRTEPVPATAATGGTTYSSERMLATQTAPAGDPNAAHKDLA